MRWGKSRCHPVVEHACPESPSLADFCRWYLPSTRLTFERLPMNPEQIGCFFQGQKLLKGVFLRTDYIFVRWHDVAPTACASREAQRFQLVVAEILEVILRSAEI